MAERASDRVLFLDGGEGQMPLKDLSESGVCCLHSVELAPGTMVDVALKELRIKAKVVHCQTRSDEVRCGLQFWDLTDDQKKSIKEMVDAFSKGIPITCRITNTK